MLAYATSKVAEGKAIAFRAESEKSNEGDRDPSMWM